MSQIAPVPSAGNQSAGSSIDEYREVCAFIRHDDQMAWTILTLAATVAFGGWAYVLKDAPLWSARALAAFAFGALALVVGRLMARRITANTRVRWERARLLEAELGFEHLTLVSQLGRTLSAPGINKTLDYIAYAAALLLAVYAVAFIVVRF